MIECNAVFKGGGAKGIAYAGALQACEDWQIDFKEVAGSSAGAITATLVACGYTAAESIALMPAALETIGGVGPSMAKLGRRSSLLSSNKLEKWLRTAIADKIVPGCQGDPPDCTFAQILDATGVSLFVVTLDLATRQPLIFCPQLTPDSPVAPAVAASSAIPVAFPPSRMIVDGQIHRLVDGGTWSNYPSFVFLDKDFRHCTGLEPTDRPTIGFVLDQEGDAAEAPSRSPAPMPGSPLVNDRGSNLNELGLPGGVLSSTIFRWAVGLTPILFVLLSLAWIAREIRGDQPAIGRLPIGLQDIALAASITVLAVTGVVATLLAFVVLRLGKSIFDTGIVGATAAMGVGPSVPYWVGTRSIGPQLSDTDADIEREAPEHVAVRIKVPNELGTLAFGAKPQLRDHACRVGRADTTAELKRSFGRPANSVTPDTAIGEANDQAGDPIPTAAKAGPLRRWLVRASRRVGVRIVALVASLFIVLNAAFEVALGLADGRVAHSFAWGAGAGAAAIVFLLLIAAMRRSEVVKSDPYRILRRARSPRLLRLLSLTAAALSIIIPGGPSEQSLSYFGAIRAEEVSAVVDNVSSAPTSSPSTEIEPLFVVTATARVDDQEGLDAFSALADLVDPISGPPHERFVDLVENDVPFEILLGDGAGDDQWLNASASFTFLTRARPEVGDVVGIRIDTDISVDTDDESDAAVAFLGSELGRGTEAQLELEIVLAAVAILLTFSFRAMRAAAWLEQEQLRDVMMGSV